MFYVGRSYAPANAFELRKSQIVWRINLYRAVGIDNNNLDCKVLNNLRAESGGQKGTWICKGDRRARGYVLSNVIK